MFSISIAAIIPGVMSSPKMRNGIIGTSFLLYRLSVIVFTGCSQMFKYNFIDRFFFDSQYTVNHKSAKKE